MYPRVDVTGGASASGLDCTGAPPLKGKIALRSIFAILATILLAFPAFGQEKYAGLGENLIPFVKSTPAPAAPITLDDGAKVTLADFEGKVAVAMFWATWCEVCELEMPEMEALAGRYAPEALTVLPISVDEGAPFAKVRAYMAKWDYRRLPAMVDTTQALFLSVGAYATPTTIIIDKFGQVVAAYIGAANWDAPEVNAYLDGLIAAEDAEASLAVLEKFTAVN
jgi:thiol-disulfide isomerase/thioredoxin